MGDDSGLRLVGVVALGLLLPFLFFLGLAIGVNSGTTALGVIVEMILVGLATSVTSFVVSRNLAFSCLISSIVTVVSALLVSAAISSIHYD